MSKRRKKPTAEVNLKTAVIKILVGSLIGTVVFFALISVSAFLCLKKDCSPESYKYFVLAIGAVAGVLCGYFSTKPIKKRGIIIGAVSSMPMFLIVALIATLISQSGMGAVGWVLGLVMLFSGAVGGIVAIN